MKMIIASLYTSLLLCQCFGAQQYSIAPSKHKELHKSLKFHYRTSSIYFDDKTVRPTVAFDYWRENVDWELPEELTDSLEFREAHNYIKSQLRLIKPAFAGGYMSALPTIYAVQDRILLFLYNHRRAMELFELHNVKMIAVTFGAVPLFIIKIYENIYIDIHSPLPEVLDGI